MRGQKEKIHSRQFWPYRLFRLPNPSTLGSPLPSSSRPPLSCPPARMYHLCRSPSGVWPEPSSYAGRYLLTKLRVQICCRYKSSANNSVPPNCSWVTQAWESGIQSNSPGGTLSSRAEKHKQGRKAKKKGQILLNLFFCVFPRNLVRISHEALSAGSLVYESRPFRSRYNDAFRENPEFRHLLEFTSGNKEWLAASKQDTFSP